MGMPETINGVVVPECLRGKLIFGDAAQIKALKQFEAKLAIKEVMDLFPEDLVSMFDICGGDVHEATCENCGHEIEPDGVELEIESMDEDGITIDCDAGRSGVTDSGDFDTIHSTFF